VARQYKSEGAVLKALKIKYPDGQYALLPQVADATGSSQSRWADAIAFGLWPSRGLEIEGFEIKVSRSDWLSELNDHRKSSAVQRFCHRWWIVAGSRDIVKPEELPVTWGLIIPRGENSLETKVKAPLLKPKSISRKFCAAVMRRASEANANYIKSIKDEMYEEVREASEEMAVVRAKREIADDLYSAEKKIRSLEYNIKNLNWRIQRYEAIEKATGVPLSQYDYSNFVRAMGARSADAAANTFESSIHHIKKCVEDMEGWINRSEEAFKAISEIASMPEIADETEPLDDASE